MTRTFLIVLLAASFAGAQVKKSDLEGVTNLKQVETTVACAGAVKASAVAGIKNLGFASIVNLRLPNEQGADIEAEAAAAKTAGINYIHIPFNGSMPDPAVADRFIKVVTEPGNQPAFIHCASGNRAAALWMIKRVLVDKWDNDKAVQEATDLGLTSAALKTFALDYIAAHKK
jgi:uncharacterized protein (TIGR01244 family)